MSSAAPSLVKPLSASGKCCSASLPTPLATKSSPPFLAVPFRPIRLFHLLTSSYSTSSLLSRVSLKKKDLTSNLVPLVAQTSDWARQEERLNEDGEEHEEKVGDDIEASGSSNEWAGTQESVEVGEGALADGGVFEPPEEAKLFVGNLPYDVDSEKLARILEPAGCVEIAEVIYNRETGQSRGFGFVTMSTVEEAEKAVEMFHRHDLDGRFLTVNKAAPRGSQPERSSRTFEPSHRIYVGNLSWEVDDARLEQLFSEHGKVVNARVVYDRETRRSRGFGFVTMSSETELNDAIAALDGQSVDGRTLRASVAEDRQRRGSFY